MSFPPKPILVSCGKCSFKKVVAPQSDVVPDIYCASECPKCGASITRTNLPNFVRSIARVFKQEIW